MIRRLVVGLYFLIGLVVAINHGYLNGGVGVDANGLWRIVNFILGVGFWPITVLTPYDFKLPHAVLKS